MSHARRIRRGMQAKATKAHDTWVAVQLAATADQDLADLESAKRQTHDLLIEGMGQRRRSGVSWRITTGADRFVVLDKLGHDAGKAEAGYYSEIRSYCTSHPDGFLVMATADGIR